MLIIWIAGASKLKKKKKKRRRGTEIGLSPRGLKGRNWKPQASSLAYPECQKEAQGVVTSPRFRSLTLLVREDLPSELKTLETPSPGTLFISERAGSIWSRTLGTSPWELFQGTASNREIAWGYIPGAWLGTWHSVEQNFAFGYPTHKSSLHGRNENGDCSHRVCHGRSIQSYSESIGYLCAN